MGRFHDRQFPGESHEYRRARDELLEIEIDLRQRIAEVAAIRRRLPPGGPLRQDYVFEEGGTDFADETTIKQTKISNKLLGPLFTTLVQYAGQGLGVRIP